jgi:uncharacterized protein with PIN domain
LLDFENKVIELLENINKKLDLLLSNTGSTIPVKESSHSQGKEGYVRPSVMVEKQEEEEKLREKPPIEGRRVCPECGGTDFRSEEDKSQILHQMGGIKIYKRVYICRHCGKQL